MCMCTAKEHYALCKIVCVRKVCVCLCVRWVKIFILLVYVCIECVYVCFSCLCVGYLIRCMCVRVVLGLCAASRMLGGGLLEGWLCVKLLVGSVANRRLRIIVALF